MTELLVAPTDTAAVGTLHAGAATENPATGNTATATPAGNPGLLALPLVLAGGFGLGVSDTGILDAPGAVIPVLLSATSVGLLIATVWAAALGQNVNATIYGVFFGFYASYGVLALGLTHQWFGTGTADAAHTVGLWLLSWLVTIGVLTVLVLRLPWTYPVLLLIVDVALGLLFAGTITGSGGLTAAGGWFVFAFVALVGYFYAGALWEETGGRPLPLGRPLIG